MLGQQALSSQEASNLDSFQAPTSFNFSVYESILNSQDRRQIKIGILQESSHLPYSDAVKRAIGVAEKGIRDLGFTPVPFFLTEDVWTQAREFAQCLQTNCMNDQLFELLEKSHERPIEEVEQLIRESKTGWLSNKLSQLYLKMRG